MTDDAAVRRYLVTYWLFQSGSSPKDICKEVRAYDAKDAEYQAGVYPRIHVEANPSYTFSVRKIEPVHESQDSTTEEQK